MSISVDKKHEIVNTFGKNKQDTGSVFVQCAILTERISNLTGYCKKYAKDIPAKRKLLQLAAIRRRFLRYMKRNNEAEYTSFIKKLSIRPI